eukprot:g36183.t1
MNSLDTSWCSFIHLLPTKSLPVLIQFTQFPKSRGHSLRIRGKPFRTGMRKNFLTQRAVNLWNSLPQVAVGGQFIRNFGYEDRLDKLGLFSLGQGTLGRDWTAVFKATWVWTEQTRRIRMIAASL